MFGTRATDRTAFGPRVTLFFPAATDCPAAVLNVGQEISSVRPRRAVRAIYTSLIVVVAGVWAHATASRHLQTPAVEKPPQGRRCFVEHVSSRAEVFASVRQTLPLNPKGNEPH